MTTESSSTVLVPRVLWAQRKDTVLVTVEVVEAQQDKLDVTETGLKFSAVQGNTGSKYAFELELFDAVDPEQTQETKTARGINLVLKKKDEEKPFWPRLVKSGKPHFVHTDFSRWKEEDEEDEEVADMGGMMGGMGGMGGMMGGMGGMGGIDFSQFANMAGGGDFPADDDDEDFDDDAGEDAEDPYQKTSKAALEEGDSN